MWLILHGLLQATLTDSATAKQRAEEAFSSSQAAISTLKRKATAYKKENRWAPALPSFTLMALLCCPYS